MHVESNWLSVGERVNSSLYIPCAASGQQLLMVVGEKPEIYNDRLQDQFLNGDTL